MKIWKTGMVPIDWDKGLLVKLPKKGNFTNFFKWRAVVLLSVPSKVLKVILMLIENDSCIEGSLWKEHQLFKVTDHPLIRLMHCVLLFKRAWSVLPDLTWC
jgi:hypothetical protein